MIDPFGTTFARTRATLTPATGPHVRLPSVASTAFPCLMVKFPRLFALYHPHFCRLRAKQSTGGV